MGNQYRFSQGGNLNSANEVHAFQRPSPLLHTGCPDICWCRDEIAALHALVGKETETNHAFRKNVWFEIRKLEEAYDERVDNTVMTADVGIIGSSTCLTTPCPLYEQSA